MTPSLGCSTVVPYSARVLKIKLRETHYTHYRPGVAFSAGSRFINQPVRNLLPVIIVGIFHRT